MSKIIDYFNNLNKYYLLLIFSADINRKIFFHVKIISRISGLQGFLGCLESLHLSNPSEILWLNHASSRIIIIDNNVWFITLPPTCFYLELCPIDLDDPNGSDSVLNVDWHRARAPATERRTAGRKMTTPTGKWLDLLLFNPNKRLEKDWKC